MISLRDVRRTQAVAASSLTHKAIRWETATLTVTTTSTTTTGSHEITVTGASGSATTTTTTVCVSVGTSSDNCSSGTADSSGNFYVLNAETKQIAGYYVNAGTLTSLTGSPYSVPASPLSMAIAPNGNFLYVGTIVQVSANNNWLLGVAPGYIYAIAIDSPNGTIASKTEPTWVNVITSAGISINADSPAWNRS